jgi:single-strand DNA-binding protein
MAGDTVITIVGNLSADPELRFTPAGAAVANFTVAVTPRQFDRQSNEWKDGVTQWWRCSVWRDAAENVAESLTKGTRVVVTGRVKANEFEKDGVKRTSMDIEVDEVGPSLRYATAKVNKTQRSGPGGVSQQQQQAFGGQAQQQYQQGGPDPWATGPAQGQQGPAQGQQQGGWGGPPQGQPQQGGWGGGAPSYDEPPF